MLPNEPDTTRIPPSPCPYCGKVSDAATSIETPHDGPTPGDVTICIYCASPLVFTAQLKMRKPLPGELDDAPPILDRAMRAVRRLDRRRTLTRGDPAFAVALFLIIRQR